MEEEKEHSLKTSSTRIYKGSFSTRAKLNGLEGLHNSMLLLWCISMQIETMALQNNALAYLFRTVSKQSKEFVWCIEKEVFFPLPVDVISPVKQAHLTA